MSAVLERSPPAGAAPAGEPLLALRQLHVSYGKTAALHGVDLRIAPGEVVALIGANGAGKSTTLRAISGLLKPTRGEILFKGHAIGGMPADRIVGQGIAQSPEERHVWPAMTVHENLALGAYLCKSATVVEERAAKVYARFPRLKERYRQLAGTLSGGEQQMLAIGRALMSEPTLLLLDEPSLGLSPRMAEEVFDFVREIHAHGVTVLLVEQNVHNALSVAARAYVYETGRIVAERPAAELLEDTALLSAYLGG
ncbi:MULTISPECIES: ABC transporter ATP-binding protein [unclassified Variovorax]|uniref:ABC transporter ATP-binding protein n=1 Tax=Variovorax TaxID=34072 RepID=UPI001C579E9A|nr:MULTISPECIES: ABC transporter ATP-binding protein [unclassified Variovorax]MDM0091441.1 ABC transporter ATP-binding protein [Variovorax sp. J22G40]MDM0149639.1 ABC transporter ATP-binding protein [Variovorax sp. J2P1-31]